MWFLLLGRKPQNIYSQNLITIYTLCTLHVVRIWRIYKGIAILKLSMSLLKNFKKGNGSNFTRSPWAISMVSTVIIANSKKLTALLEHKRHKDYPFAFCEYWNLMRILILHTLFTDQATIPTWSSHGRRTSVSYTKQLCIGLNLWHEIPTHHQQHNCCGSSERATGYHTLWRSTVVF